MNRKQEYQDLLLELDQIPPALDHAVARASARARKQQGLRKFLYMPASSAAAVFLAFVVMINVSVTFALACEQIPFLRELAAAVSFSPSLRTAVENEYVQTIDLEQTVNGITMRVEYVIVDQKQLNVFYTLQSQEYSHMSVTPAVFHADGQYVGASIWGGAIRENGELQQFTLDFVDNDMPDSLVFEFKVHAYESSQTSAPVNISDEPLEFSEPDPISTFTFKLDFDPRYTQQGKIIALNQDVVLDGQNLTVASAEIYPTHIRVNFTADADNTAWLYSLKFYFINEKGDRFDPIANGITATGSADSPMMASHRLESSYFYQSESLTMYITDVVWLSKDMERVRVDLANSVAERLPQGVELVKAARNGNSWDLTFAAVEHTENASYGLFGTTYYDEVGNEYMYNSWSSGATGYYDESTGQYVETPGVFRVQFTLKDYPHDVVYLTPIFSHFVELGTPVGVRVK